MALRFQARYQIDGYDVSVPSTGPVITVHRSVSIDGASFTALPDTILSGDQVVTLMADATLRLRHWIDNGVPPALSYYMATRDALYAVAPAPEDV